MKEKELDDNRTTFLVKPKQGQIVKVYVGSKDAKYGIVQKVEVLYNGLKMREMAILKQTDRVFDTIECDFFLDAKKVKWQK